MDQLQLAFCDTHLAELKNHLGELGLTRFISPDQAEEKRRNAARFLGKENWDPLALAQARVAMAAFCGFSWQQLEELGSGPLCMVCAAIKLCPCGKKTDCGALGWLRSAAEAEHTRAVEYGLVASA